MVPGHRPEPVGEAVLGAGEEPHQGRARQHRAQYVEPRVCLVVEAGDDHRPLGHEGDANARRPEQVGREDDGVIPLAEAQDVLEDARRTELEAEPAHLVVEVGDAAGLYGKLGLQRRPAGVADDGETPHQQAIFLTCTLGQHVGPAVVVEGARGHDLDVMATARQTGGRLGQQRLGATEHAGAEAGRDERQLHLGAGRGGGNTTPA